MSAMAKARITVFLAFLGFSMTIAAVPGDQLLTLTLPGLLISLLAFALRRWWFPTPKKRAPEGRR